MFDRTQTTEHEDGQIAYRSLTMNDCLDEVSDTGMPSMLFGEFWFEGELAMLAGDTGLGKSVMAMQIAESIASGKSIEPLEMTAGKRPVLYIDLEMNATQLAMRYSGDPKQPGKLTGIYKFSSGLHRVEIDAERLVNTGSPEQTAHSLGRLLEEEIRKHGATVVIIDSLTALKRSYYGSNELLPVIRTLKRLAAEHSLSILVVADVPRTERVKSLTLNTLGGLRLAANAVDSIFAIGQSGHNTAARYVKHLRAKSVEIVYNALHAPEFILKKIGGNFLGFEFEHIMSEKEFLKDQRHAGEQVSIEHIKHLRWAGFTIREIAARYGKSKTTIHRLLQLWEEPQPEKAAPPSTAVDPGSVQNNSNSSLTYEKNGNGPQY